MKSIICLLSFISITCSGNSWKWYSELTIAEGVDATFQELKEAMNKKNNNGKQVYLIGVAQWLARRARDQEVAGSIPTTSRVVIALGKQFTYISSVHSPAKWVPGFRQLKCIDYQ